MVAGATGILGGLLGVLGGGVVVSDFTGGVGGVVVLDSTGGVGGVVPGVYGGGVGRFTTFTVCEASSRSS